MPAGLFLSLLLCACAGSHTLSDLRVMEQERDAYALSKIFLASPSGDGRTARVRSRRIRDEAGEALVRLGPAGVPELARALKYTAPKDLGRVADVLARITPQGIDALLSFVESHPEMLHRSVAEALATARHPRAVPLLIGAFHESLKQRDPRTVWLATCLGRVHSPAANDVLLASWPRTERRSVRLALLEAMGEGGARDCVNVAITALADPDDDVRRAAALALGGGGPRGIEVVVRLFFSPRPGEQGLGEAGVRTAGAAAVLPLLKRVGPLPERSLDVQARAADCLVHYATKGQVGVELTDRYGRALRALADGLPETAAGLTRAFEDSDAALRRVAAQALGLLQSAAGLAAVAQVAVDDANEWVRAEAALALGLICDEVGAVELACQARLERRANRPSEAQLVGCSRARLLKLCRDTGLAGLSAAAQDPRPRVRLAVAQALVQLIVGGAVRGDPLLIDTLQRLGVDPDEKVGFEARQGLRTVENLMQ